MVLPSTPEDAKGMLIDSVLDPNPVIFIEHRWLHNLEGDVPKGFIALTLAELTSLSTDLMSGSGGHVNYGYEASHAVKFLAKSTISQ